MIPPQRAAQAAREALETLNRASGGNGAGGSFLALALAGQKAAGNQGGYSTANSSTWTDITNTSFTIHVSRTTWFIYLVYATAHISAGAGNGYFRGTIVGFDNTASPFVNTAGAENGLMPYFPPNPIAPADYTVKMQAATDAGTTITIDQFFHLLLFCNA